MCRFLPVLLTVSFLVMAQMQTGVFGDQSSPQDSKQGSSASQNNHASQETSQTSQGSGQASQPSSASIVRGTFLSLLIIALLHLVHRF